MATKQNSSSLKLPPVFTDSSGITYYRPYYDSYHRLTRNATIPEVVIRPDSLLSPGERAVRERERQRNHDNYYGLGTYSAMRDLEDTQANILRAEKAWENSPRHKTLKAMEAVAQGVGIGSDIVSTSMGGVPVYSILKGSLALNKAVRSGNGWDYAESALWLSPIIGAAGREMYNASKPVWSFLKGIPNIADRYFFVKHPGTYTRGIGITDAGLLDAVATGVFRGNPRGTEITAREFTKGTKFNRDNFLDIMDATGIKDIASKFQSRTLSEKEFNAIKEASKNFKRKGLVLEDGIFTNTEYSADPLYEYPDYKSYLKSIQQTISKVNKMPGRVTSGKVIVNQELTPDEEGVLRGRPIEERFGPNSDYISDGHPMSYWYDDSRNPITEGYEYAKSNYGVRVNNPDTYQPFMHEFHLHPSFFKSPRFNDPNVEIFAKGPLGLTVKLDKQTLQPLWKQDLTSFFRRALDNYRYPLGRPIVPENFLTFEPKIRTRIGDVEIDNPQLAYRQGEGIVDDFIKRGVVEAAPPSESNIITTERGLTFDFTPQRFDLPMFSQGRPWFGVGKKPKSKEMLVTAESLSKSNANGGLEPWEYNGTFDIRYDLGKPHSPGWLRRVPDYEQVLNTSNTSAYRWEPGYGYRRVFTEEPSTISWSEALRGKPIP